MKLHKPIKAPSPNKDFANEHMHLKSHYNLEKNLLNKSLMKFAHYRSSDLLSHTTSNFNSRNQSPARLPPIAQEGRDVPLADRECVELRGKRQYSNDPHMPWAQDHVDLSMHEREQNGLVNTTLIRSPMSLSPNRKKHSYQGKKGVSADEEKRIKGISKVKQQRIEHLLPVIQDEGARQKLENRFLYLSQDSPFFANQKTPDVPSSHYSSQQGGHGTGYASQLTSQHCSSMVKLPDIDPAATLGSTHASMMANSRSMAEFKNLKETPLQKEILERMKNELGGKAVKRKMKAMAYLSKHRVEGPKVATHKTERRH